MYRYTRNSYVTPGVIQLHHIRVYDIFSTHPLPRHTSRDILKRQTYIYKKEKKTRLTIIHII